MSVDGRIVGQALSATIKPLLRDLGFDRFQGRHSWRRTEYTVDLVTFPSMNAYTADGVGCTTFSFGCGAGVYYPDLEVVSKRVEWPRDYHLTFRSNPRKTLRQPLFHPWGEMPVGDQAWRRDRADVWYVLEDGSNLDEVVADAADAVAKQAIPFIRLHDDPEEALRSLRTFVPVEDLESTQLRDFGKLNVWAPGIGSPRNLQLIEQLSDLLAARK